MVFGHTPRILVAKPGPDGRDHSAKIVARALKDAGCEVIYAGLEQTEEMIAAAAIQEDVDAIGLAGMSADYIPMCRRLVELLKAKGADDIMVLVHGVVSSADVPMLEEWGVKGIFPEGQDMEAPAAFIREQLLARAESFADQASRGNL